ncbi:SusD/RagB family nutrient-binding outer membrane lipoprotein [Dyadobacter sp. CY356]|uniref:SusD/RagB family nutrient-binding outer membrane lipoprotein n=1 Tax=Dyadobacter sp. CY356 TaxID=2906442 RepID=UPI001F2CAAC5|nr:SusD/RagB family nutrient-binding outer membrane lipoprotein [Dyadobacter sp. CY356]MCF0057394.1 SusD/RagB family nutrient-binding outer membrane lipoprotein [Dyadobacter sp. CY356]
MKKISKLIVFSLLLVSSACTDKFEEINTDPNKTSAAVFNANYLLSQTQYSYSNTGYSQLLFQSMWTQVLASTFSYYGNGDKYRASGSFVSYQSSIFTDSYNAASRAVEMQNLVADKPEMSNLYNIGAIMKVLCIARVTDSYGDAPYSEALQAKSEIYAPKYDTQQEIYSSMLTELETAVKNLDAAKSGPTADLFYAGNIAQWKKFGYSLMLRLAMRMTKVDAAMAKTWAEKAVAGGVFTSITDNAKVVTDNGTGNSNATTNALRVADDYREVRWSKTFIDYLKATKDPRISAVAEVSKQGYTNNSNQDLAGDNTEALQIGLPNGYDLNGGATDISTSATFPGDSPADPSIKDDKVARVGKYSRPRTSVYLDRSGTNFILTYGETELMLAEAKVRGWNVTGTAAEHYSNGVTASIASLAQFNKITVSDAAITSAISGTAAFLSANPLASSTEGALKQINEQYWVTTGTLFNFIETWNNWKRSGYPVLTPVVYPGGFSNGTIPRRIPYGANEPVQNPKGYAEALSRLGGTDSFTARTWWDKQ